MNAPTIQARKPDYAIDSLFVERWSPRAFSEAAMTEADVLTLLEAARWAPSASNLQPWRFAWGLRGDAGFAAIADALVPFNTVWATKAAALIVVASQTTTQSAAGDTVPNKTHAFDAGTAWGSLAFQAYLKGWATHAMGGFDHAKAAANLHMPEDYALHAVVAVGYRGDPATLPDALRARETPSGRRALSEIAHHGSFA